MSVSLYTCINKLAESWGFKGWLGGWLFVPQLLMSWSSGLALLSTSHLAFCQWNFCLGHFFHKIHFYFSFQNIWSNLLGALLFPSVISSCPEVWNQFCVQLIHVSHCGKILKIHLSWWGERNTEPTKPENESINAIKRVVKTWRMWMLLAPCGRSSMNYCRKRRSIWPQKDVVGCPLMEQPKMWFYLPLGRCLESWGLFWKGSSLLVFQLCLVTVGLWGGKFPGAVGFGDCWALQQFGDLMNEVRKRGFSAAPT